MRNLITTVKSFFEIALDVHNNNNASILLIESRKVITSELRKAKEQRRVIGIHCPKLGSGLILTKVEDLVEQMLLLRLLDVEGNIQDIIEIEIGDIEGVSPFNTRFTPAVHTKKHSVIYS